MSFSSSWLCRASSAARNFHSAISSESGGGCLGECPNSFSPKRSRRNLQLDLWLRALAEAKAAVCFARCFRARRRQQYKNAMKINAQPSAIKRISHHDKACVVVLVGVERPEIDGRGEDPELEEDGTRTSCVRHAPRPGTTLVPLLQFAATQVPPRRTWLELEQARQLFGPEPEQLAQLPSHD